MTDDELAAELAELLGDPDPAEPTTADEIRIAIARGLRRMLHLHGRCERLEAVYDAERARIDQWLDSYREPIRKVNAENSERLATLHAMLLELDPKALTVDTPAGVHGSTKAKEPSIDWLEDLAFVEWARQRRPDLVRESFAPDKPAAKKALACADDVVIEPGTGEVVPGLGVKQPVRTYHVRLASRDDG
jgi:hypothetical protein